MSVCSFGLSVCLSACLPVWLSVCVSVWLFVFDCPSACLSVCLCEVFVCSFVCMVDRLRVCVSDYDLCLSVMVLATRLEPIMLNVFMIMLCWTAHEMCQLCSMIYQLCSLLCSVKIDIISIACVLTQTFAVLAIYQGVMEHQLMSLCSYSTSHLHCLFSLGRWLAHFHCPRRRTVSPWPVRIVEHV